MRVSKLNRTVTVTTKTGRSMLLPWKLLFVRLIFNEKEVQTKKIVKISLQRNEGHWQVLHTTSTVFVLYNT
jgi:hypothetical protein